jgi:hypothetical protein
MNMKSWVAQLLKNNPDVDEFFLRINHQAGPLVIEVFVDDDAENEGRVLAVYETGLQARTAQEARLVDASPLAEEILLQGAFSKVS